MTIAEFFVNLGVKGDDKVKASLAQTKGSLGEISASALAMKAAILGGMYALQRLTSSSNQTGTALQQFKNNTGLSIQTLQQYQYAGQQVGATNEEVTSSIVSLQNAVAKMRLGQGPVNGLEYISKYAGGLDAKKLDDPFYLLQKYQKFVQTAPAALSSQITSFAGISQGVLSGMHQNIFREDIFKKAPAYTDKEVSQLQKIGAGWANLGQKIEMSVGHLNAKHGNQLIKDISTLTTQIFKLVDAFTVLSDKLRVFDAITLVFEGWTDLFKLLNEAAESFMGKFPDKGGKKKPLKELFVDKASSVLGGALGAVQSLAVTPAPLVRTPYPRQSVTNHNNNTTIHNQGVKDSHQSVDLLRREIENTYRQSSGLAQGS